MSKRMKKSYGRNMEKMEIKFPKIPNLDELIRLLGDAGGNALEALGGLLGGTTKTKFPNEKMKAPQPSKQSANTPKYTFTDVWGQIVVDEIPQRYSWKDSRKMIWRPDGKVNWYPGAINARRTRNRPLYETFTFEIPPRPKPRITEKLPTQGTTDRLNTYVTDKIPYLEENVQTPMKSENWKPISDWTERERQMYNRMGDNFMGVKKRAKSSKVSKRADGPNKNKYF